MEEVCKVCGLEKSICICQKIEKESIKINIYSEKRSFGKIVTIISGIQHKDTAKDLCKKLKKKLACGGTIGEGDVIELQGDHKQRVLEILIQEGYNKENIEII